MCESRGNKSLQLGKYFNRNTIVSILSGILFAAGWWLIIDTTVQYPDLKKIYHIIGIIATLALILTNLVSNSQIRNNAYRGSQFGARLFLFFSFVLAFGSLIASAWIFFGVYIRSKSTKFYPGLAIFGQNIAIFLSTLMLKLGRKEDLPSY